MCHEWAPAAWWFALRTADEQLVEAVQKDGCPHCGGRLDRADYPRKARGLPACAEEAFAIRFSLCCARFGCRRRSTPPSLRFLGRRVYVAAVVVLAGVRRVASVPPRTEGRWLAWWRGVFAASALWQVGRGLLREPVAEGDLPGALLELFGGCTPASVRSLLGLLVRLQGHVP